MIYFDFSKIKLYIQLKFINPYPQGGGSMSVHATIRRYRLLSIMLAFVLSIFSHIGAFAQQKVELRSGREFYFGIPHVWRQATAFTDDSPWGLAAFQVWVGSEVDTKIFLEAPAIGVARVYLIKAGEIKIIPLDDILMNTQSEVITNNGIHILADDPVTVTGYSSYRVSGEAFTVIPMENLGKRYFTTNMYQDFTGANTDYRPAQFMIVATEDNTSVTFMPNTETEKGVKKGQVKQVTLRKGQTYLVKAKIQPSLNQTDASDLSGTEIISNKPIAVISGHTKAAFPRFTGTMLGTTASFMRNSLMDMMWPVEFLGKEYIAVPMLHTSRPYNAIDQQAKGDLIRFVAIEDGTIIYRLAPDGVTELQLSKELNKGQFFDVVESEVATIFRSNKNVMATQYGKSWRLTTPGALIKDGKNSDNADLLNPSKNGQGTMMPLTPNGRWASHAIFNSPDGMNNFVNVVFPSDQIDSIFFDNISLRNRYGSVIKTFAGTPYSYLSEPMGSGTHIIRGTGQNSKFATYVYGSLDGLKTGFAYGYPTGVNYALNMPADSMEITSVMNCGNVTGTATIVHEPNAEYAGFHSIYLDLVKSTNYKLGTKPSPVTPGSDKADFTLTVIDPSKDAKAVVVFADRTGSAIIKTFEYTAKRVEGSVTVMDFGLLPVGQKNCLQIEISNPLSVPVSISSLELKLRSAEFTWDASQFPMTLNAGEKRSVQVCGQSITGRLAIDTLVAKLDCYGVQLTQLKIRSGKPLLQVADWDFGKVPVDIESPAKELALMNVSEADVDVVVTGVDWADKTHFRVEGLEASKFPITIKRDQPYLFKVYYKPNALTFDTTVALFTANATEIKLNSRWTGAGIDARPNVTGYDWGKRRMGFAYDGEVVVYNPSPDNSVKVTIQSINLEGTNTDAFELDADDVSKLIGQDIYGMSSITLRTKFTPKTAAEFEFPFEYNDVRVVVTGKAPNGTVHTTSASLRGIGIQPHLGANDQDFGRLFIGTTSKFTVTIKNQNASGKFGTDHLLVNNLKITGRDAQYFSIDPAWLASQPTSWSLAINATIEVPIIFAPTIIRDGANRFEANLAFDEDAPETVVPLLTGQSYANYKVATEPYDFGTHFIKYKQPIGDVGIKFQSAALSQKLNIVRADIVAKPGADPNDTQAFTISVTNVFPFTITPNTVAPSDFGTVAPLRLSFYPTRTGRYEAQVKFTAEDASEYYADITGVGEDMQSLVMVPTGYSAKPGEFKTIEVKLRDNVDRADVDNFTVTVTLNPHIAMPQLSSNGKPVISTVQNLLNGWTIVSADTLRINDKALALKLSFTSPAGKTLIGSGTLFTFDVRGMLSIERKTAITPAMAVSGRDFLTIAQTPGDIQIEEVCVNDLRNVVLSENGYAFYRIAPNPVDKPTTISFDIAFDATTRIEMVNTNGVVVAVLVDGVLSAGSHSVVLDPSLISSGVYTLRMTSGVFRDAQSVLIVK